MPLLCIKEHAGTSLHQEAFIIIIIISASFLDFTLERHTYSSVYFKSFLCYPASQYWSLSLFSHIDRIKFKESVAHFIRFLSLPHQCYPVTPPRAAIALGERKDSLSMIL